MIHVIRGKRNVIMDKRSQDKKLKEIEIKQNKYVEKISAVSAEQLAKALETLLAKDKDLNNDNNIKKPKDR